MNRRDFLKNSVFASSMALTPTFMKGMEFLTPSQLSGYKNLVVIQLSGGNDGLNSVIPFRADPYYDLRSEIAIDKGKILRLNDELGLNPSLAPLLSLYDKGELCIINNVGYPNPNRSHFRSMDIWHSASDSDAYVQSGWLGRYLDANCKNAHGIIEVDDGLSLAMKGEHSNGIAAKNPWLLHQSTNTNFFRNLTNNISDSELLDEDNQGYLYKTLVSTSASSQYIQKTRKIYDTKGKYPQNKLGGQLKTIASFIASGLSTRVYYTSLGGFDTHVYQNGPQNNLLKQYATSVEAFVEDLKHYDRFKDTLILTFSEFGRRVKENASRGTDHGTASNVYVVGGNLNKAGIYNDGPDLLNLDDNGDLKYKVDFRSVYATVLHKWLEVDDKQILNRNFDRLNFV